MSVGRATWWPTVTARHPTGCSPAPWGLRLQLPTRGPTGLRVGIESLLHAGYVRDHLQIFAPSSVTFERAIDPNIELIGFPLFAYGYSEPQNSL
jgi:hypothetical protein